MKTKILFLAFLLILVSCSNKEREFHYAKLEMEYRSMAQEAEFVMNDQKGIIETGLVSLLDTDTPTFRKATEEDELKAIDLSFEMATLVDFLNQGADFCKSIKESYKCCPY
jgi:hypothetical protein